MLRWLARFVLFRVLGARVLAVLAILGFIRRQLAGRKATTTRTRPTPEQRSAASRRSTSKIGSTPGSESTSRSGSTSGR
jgi:hypothetical protein